MLTRSTAIVYLAMAWLNLEACTIVQVQGADPRIVLYPGLAQVDVHAAADAPTVVSTSGFGLVMSARSSTLGWIRESVATVPDTANCRVIFMQDSAVQAKQIVEGLGRLRVNLDNICVIDKGERE